MSERLMADTIGETGFYGKIPSQGDFVVRRLRNEFVQQWDAWLQQWIGFSREALGAEWQQLYQDAPVWRFLLAPGTCGDNAWAGLFQPSVDRVGRYFPLTVAAALPSDLDVLETMNAARPWYDSIERTAAAAFTADVRLDDLDARLLATQFPARAIIAEDAAEDTLPLAERTVNALMIAAGADTDFATVRTTLHEEQVNVGHSHCVWLNASASPNERFLLVTQSLPLPQFSCAFLDGRWVAHGWGDGRSDTRLSA